MKRKENAMKLNLPGVVEEIRRGSFRFSCNVRQILHRLVLNNNNNNNNNNIPFITLIHKTSRTNIKTRTKIRKAQLYWNYDILFQDEKKKIPTSSLWVENWWRGEAKQGRTYITLLPEFGSFLWVVVAKHVCFPQKQNVTCGPNKNQHQSIITSLFKCCEIAAEG